MIIIRSDPTYAHTVVPEMLLSNQSSLVINITLGYTRLDDLTVKYISTTNVSLQPGIFWFDGVKATPDSPPNLTCEPLSSAPLVGTYLS